MSDARIELRLDPGLTRAPVEHVDLTPDRDLPLRILRVYRLNCDCLWEVHGLDPARSAVYDVMNEHQAARAAILDKAIRVLEEARL